jgi:uroporphyrinogen decarboxylase
VISMTTKERFTRMFNHQEADRVPIIDGPWAGTISRWIREGMPKGADWRDYFDVDKVEGIGVNITPNYEYKVIEETDRYIINTSPWGVTMKNLKTEDSTPEFLDFKVTTPEAWADAKKRMTVDKNRIDWKYLENNYSNWVASDRWIQAGFWFGFDVAHSWMVGTETLLIAMIEEPEWVKDMFNTYLDMCIAHFDMIWDAGYRFDSIAWPDDMGYKNTPFFSNEMYRKLLKPVHTRAVQWAHNKGIKAHLHSCGDIMPLMPDVLETGIDALNPLEIKAGMDVVGLKRDYGKRLVLHGGINAVLWDKKDEITAEIERLVPILKENGGYIFSSDHSIPNSVSLDNFKQIISTVKRCGTYT